MPEAYAYKGIGLSRMLTFLLLSLTGVSICARAQSQPLITAKIDNSARSVIAHSTHPLVNSAIDAGRVSGSLAMERLILVLGPGPEQENNLRGYLASLQDKNSPNYHHWLTPDEFGRKFGPNPADIQQVKSWLQQQGFSVGPVARSGRWIEFSGTAQQVESAFQTQMRRYQVQGEQHIANATDISLPAALGPVVRGVLSLHDFFRKPLLAQHYNVLRNDKGNLTPVDPEFTAGRTNPQHYLAPGDFAGIYDFAPLYQEGVDGTGQTIAIVSRSNLELTDVDSFRQIFNLPANDPKFILNGPDPGIFGEDSLEATLDVEWSGAIAPNATVDLVISASTVTTDGVDLSAAYIVDNNLAGVMSESYGACEQDLGPVNAFYNALWQQASAQGISVFVSSGDNGAAGCDNPNGGPAHGGPAVNGLASTAYNTAVGGTQFSENGNDLTYWSNTNGPGFVSANGYIPEMVWNESCDPTLPNSPCAGQGYNLFAGSGGASMLHGKPSWQTGPNIPQDDHRDLPDVSLAAAGGHDGFLLCYFGSCQTKIINGQLVLNGATVVGGTSASSPSWAAILALVNQKTRSRQGLANYVLYRLAASQDFNACNSSNLTDPTVSTRCIFYDITAGNNNVPGQTGFRATSAFDLATGLGSVNTANLVNAWSSLGLPTFTTLSSGNGTISMQHGQPVQLNIGVQAVSGNGVPSGAVAMMTDKYGAAGTVNLTGGSFSGPVTALPGGQYNLFAHYQGDGIFGASDSTSIPVNIAPENSTLSLNSWTYGFFGPYPATTEPYGWFLYLHSAVRSGSGNGAATGTVTYQDASVPIGTITLNSKGEGELVSGGFSSLGANLCLTVGTHTITASYSGDNSLNPSTTAQPLTITVTKGNPTVIFSGASPVNIFSTQQLLLHVYVENTGPILPTGTVQFVDGSTSLGTVTIVSPNPDTVPQAVLAVSLAPGGHLISATYSGDSVYSTALSNSPLQVNVTTPTGVSTQTTLTPDSNSSTVGQVVKFTVNVTSSQSTPALTGTVQLVQQFLGPLTAPVTLQNGSATIPIQWEFAGPQYVVAQYSGDANYAASGSAPSVIAVDRATPSLSLTSNTQAVQAGQQVSLTVTISQGCGQIQFVDAVNGAAPKPLGPPHFPTFSDGFICRYGLPVVLPYGTNVITAQYLGDPEFNPATSNPVTVIVTRQSTSATLTSSPNPSSLAQAVTFMALVTSAGNGATGTVTFSDNGSPIGTGTVNGLGVATFTTSSLSGGSHSITAAYSGDSLFADSASAPLTQVVNKDATSLVIVSSSNPAGVNQSITLTANVASQVGVPATGTVTFYDGANQLGTANVGSPLSVSFATVGPHTITAIYPGDNSHLGSTGILQQVVNDSGTTHTTTTLTYSHAPSFNSPKNAGQVLFHQSVTLTAAVNPAPSLPTGQMIFVDGSTVLGEVSLDVSGAAALPIAAFSVGTHSITAYYLGDSTNAGSSATTTIYQSARPR